MSDHGNYYIRRWGRQYVISTDKNGLSDQTIISHPLGWTMALQFRKELVNGEVTGNDPRLKHNRPGFPQYTPDTPEFRARVLERSEDDSA